MIRWEQAARNEVRNPASRGRPDHAGAVSARAGQRRPGPDHRAAGVLACGSCPFCHGRCASYEQWSATCDTLHAHTQVLGKLAVALAPPEPQLQHAALRLTARGWETAPLPAPDGSGRIVALLDLRSHEAVAEHSNGAVERIPLTPDRPVGQVTTELLGALRRMARRRADRSDATGSAVERPA